MNADRTHISVILDRTGSMEAIRDDTIGGFNAFVKEQRRARGTATLTLVQFDSQDPYEVLQDWVDIQSVPLLTRENYVPRASTPLLDAMGRGILELERALEQRQGADAPDKVITLVITDGHENASREFTRETIRQMVAERQARGWQFVFLSADLEGIDDALHAGVRAAQSMAFDRHGGGIGRAMASTSQRVTESRANRRDDVQFEDADRDQQAAERRRRARRPGGAPGRERS